ncbi:MAG: hypothetical protein ACFB5Z_19205 [Elainellaceae cyanobacterium]
MSYKEFSLEQINRRFQIAIESRVDLFGDRPPSLDLNPAFKGYLDYSARLGLSINTEKSRSEMIIAPMLIELKRLTEERISVFSGVEFSVEPEQGLNGFCDFIVSQSEQQLYIESPVAIIFEAKNENIKGGLGQCLAAMLAAQRFNQARDAAIDAVFGAVTTGNQWKFLKLLGQSAYIDAADYYIDPLGRIMGVLYALAMPTVSPVP